MKWQLENSMPHFSSKIISEDSKRKRKQNWQWRESMEMRICLCLYRWSTCYVWPSWQSPIFPLRLASELCTRQDPRWGEPSPEFWMSWQMSSWRPTLGATFPSLAPCCRLWSRRAASGAWGSVKCRTRGWVRPAPRRSHGTSHSATGQTSECLLVNLSTVKW